MNAFIKFSEILLIRSYGIEWKRNSDPNEGPPLGYNYKFA